MKLLPPFLRFYLLTAALLLSGLGFGQVQDLVAISGVQASQSATIPNITASPLTRGSGISQASGSTYNSSGWTTSQSVDSNDYIEWSVTANTGNTVTINKVEIVYDRSGSGPTQVAIRTNVDGFTSNIFTDAGVSASTETVDFNTNLTSSLAGTIIFRLYGYDSDGGSGTFDIEGGLGTVLGLNETGIVMSGIVGGTGYCPSSFSEDDADAITNVTLTNSSSAIILDKDSGDAHVSNINGYEDFTSLTPTDLEQGQTYNLSVSIDPDGAFEYDAFVFFDWDADLSFTGAIDEEYDLGFRDTIGSLDVDITVPSGAILGNTRMRVVMINANSPNACDPQPEPYGETEDYTINIISASSCNLTNLGLSNITCNNNGTPTDASDDITSFQLNPTGNNLGTTYSVDMAGNANISLNPTGPFTTDVASGNGYGSAITFYLEQGSAGDGDIEGLVIDESAVPDCFEIATISDPGSCSSGGAIVAIYDADFSNDGDGFADHTSSNPPAAAPASVGPFGASPNAWFLSYTATEPATDGSSNSFEVISSVLISDDWGGQGIFESQVIDVSLYNMVNIIAESQNSGANDDIFKYFYILDGGARVETANINSNNGDALDYNIPNLDVSSASSLVVGFEFDENGGNDGYETSSFIVTAASNQPNLLVSETNISELEYVVGNGPSNAKPFDVSGTNLDGSDVTITASTNFEVSSTEFGTYTNAQTITAFDGTLSTFWTRLVQGTPTSLPVNIYTGDITIVGGGAAQQSINLNGAVLSDGTGSIICAAQIDFEIAGNGYTASIPEFSDGSKEYFTQTDGSDISSTIEFTNPDGSYFAAQDIDGQGATLPVNLNVLNVDISNLTDLEFSIDLAEDSLHNRWDEPDYVHIYYTIDGGTEQNLLWIENDGSQFNSVPLIDTNFDGNGDGAQITDTFTTFTESIPVTGTTMEIRIEFNLDSEEEDIAIDNISVCGIDNSIDNDSQVNQPTTQIPAGVIVADETTLFSEALPVFRFEVEDLGTADVLDTTISQFRLVPGTGNTASWSQVIQGVEIVADGGGGQVFDIDQVVSISDTEIIVQIINTPQFEMTTGDGSTRGYTIGVYLNPTGITDQEVIQFAIPNSSSYWTVETNSSQFVTNFTPFEGNLFTIDVVGNGLEFILQPTTTIVNEQMFTVQLANTDTNGNIDLALVNQVIVSSTGTLTGDPISATPQNGIATFNALQHTEVGNGLSLNASSDALSIVSESFDIIIIPELFITEVADPSDNFEGRFIEVFNAGVQEIDFDNSNYFLVRQRASSTEINNIKLTGVIPAKGYFVIGQGAFNYFIDTYGFTPEQLDADAGGTIAGNGDDPYFISLDDTSDIKLKNSAIDIYGVIDVDGTGEVWDYEDNRSYRDNPTIKNANSDWTFNEWTIESAAVDDMTPGYGDNDYIYNGAWNTIGLGNPNSTTTTGAQNIFIRSGSTTLTADTTIGDLVVRAGATLTIDGLLQVTGDIVNEGTIIFNSTATQTAVLGAVASNTRVVGDGFEVRRYFSANRSFRYVSSSVNSTENIQTNWQEGAISATENPISGFGTHITGTLLGTNLGFDATATGNPSMFTWNNATQDWDDLPSTNNTDLEIGIGHAILIRGDRSIDLSTNTPTAVPTTLRSTGSIHIRDFVVPNMPTTEPTLANPIFALIGNPYQAQVNMSTILDNHASGMNPNYMYVYDPIIGDRGGYATVTLATGNSTSVPDTSFANQFLQPNQAVFVETTTASPSLTFVESAKLDAFANLQTFSDEASIVPTNLSINLVNSEIQKVVDGVKLNTASENSNEVNYEDALKLWNSSEHFAIRNANQYLSIERREMPQANDSLFFYVGNYQVEEYALQFKNTLPADVEVVLVDQYLNEIHTVNQNESNYPFSVDFNLPESLGSDRFLIIFGSVNLSIKDFSVENNIKIYPNPVSNGSVNILLPLEVEVNTKIQISVFDVLGSKIMEQNRQPLNQTIPLDVSGLPVGVYLLEAKQGKNKFIQKMIVE